MTIGDGNEGRVPLALCGLGRFAKKRLVPAILASKSVVLAAVVCRHRPTISLPGDVLIAPSLGELLIKTNVKAIYIATPNFLHAEQSMASLSAGLNVICEKPMAIKFADCKKMIESAKTAGLAITVGHMLRFSPVVRLVRHWIQSGRIGDVESIRTIFNYELPESARSWACQSAQSGGGALLDAGIHCIDVIRFLIGVPVIPVSCRLDYDMSAGGVEHKAEACLLIDDIKAEVSVSSKAEYLTELSIVGSHGRIVVHNFAASWGTSEAILFLPASKRPSHREVVDVSNLYSAQLDHFSRLVQSTQKDYSHALDAAENVLIVEKLYQLSSCMNQ